MYYITLSHFNLLAFIAIKDLKILIALREKTFYLGPKFITVKYELMTNLV